MPPSNYPKAWKAKIIFCQGQRVIQQMVVQVLVSIVFFFAVIFWWMAYFGAKMA